MTPASAPVTDEALCRYFFEQHQGVIRWDHELITCEGCIHPSHTP